MNRLRAEEIAASPELRTVIYKGERVYIQNVDPTNDTARVYHLDDPGNEFEVQLVHLSEQ
ncbi:H-type small acid-soluble spore protein [Bacillus sp. FJAT-50079]|uniref:H-type small acid-soluble spore protein n=1 Tax=Bacillus sp. FJAT-50079 TaxID=2833577 RepID=UPI001BC988BD|nr:H-type small acid-soluble spore protein [Bacillus sp. FJAT-50079]MBS4207028.1 H-type small acid-soluble spore protein [Bacillus sp. FJAT-50079]